MIHLKVEKVLEANDILNQSKSTTTSKSEQQSATVSAMHVVNNIFVMNSCMSRCMMVLRSINNQLMILNQVIARQAFHLIQTYYQRMRFQEVCIRYNYAECRQLNHGNLRQSKMLK